MTLVNRAATLVALTFSLTGLTALGAPGNAAELAYTAPAVRVAPTINPQPAISVPAPITAPVEADAPLASDESIDDDTVAYPTLAAAVAAHVEKGDVDEQLRCLAVSVYYESKGEPLAGQLAVAQVILNRAAAGRFGNSVCAVIKQPGQFSFVRGGRLPSVDAARPAYRTALAISKVALAEAWKSDAGRALFFHARRVSPGWKRTRVASIGNHVFYR